MTSDFEREYSASGVWARLFRKSPDYRGTVLLRHPETDRRYIVIDEWLSKSSYERFKARYAEEYAEIDARCKKLIEAETRLGIFEVLYPGA